VRISDFKGRDPSLTLRVTWESEIERKSQVKSFGIGCLRIFKATIFYYPKYIICCHIWGALFRQLFFKAIQTVDKCLQSVENCPSLWTINLFFQKMRQLPEKAYHHIWGAILLPAKIWKTQKKFEL
jgi:hypothetical protein